MQVATFTLLKNSDARVKLTENSIKRIRKLVLEHYGTIKNFAKEVVVSKDAMVNWLSKEKRRTFVPLEHLWLLSKKLNLNIAYFMGNIIGLSTKGAHSVIQLPKKISINDETVKTLGLYVGDGYMSKKASKVIFTNTNPKLIRLFYSWALGCLGVKKSFVIFTIYTNDLNRTKILKTFKLSTNYKVKFYKHKNPHQKTSCKVVINYSIYRKLLDELITYSKNLCLNNKQIAIAYLKGLFAAEGCISMPKGVVPAVFIEMKTGPEINFVEKLFILLDIKYRKYYRPRDRIKLVIYRKAEVNKLKHFNFFETHPDKFIKSQRLYPGASNGRQS